MAAVTVVGVFAVVVRLAPFVFVAGAAAFVAAVVFAVDAGIGGDEDGVVVGGRVEDRIRVGVRGAEAGTSVVSPVFDSVFVDFGVVVDVGFAVLGRFLIAEDSVGLTVARMWMSLAGMWVSLAWMWMSLTRMWVPLARMWVSLARLGMVVAWRWVAVVTMSCMALKPRHWATRKLRRTCHRREWRRREAFRHNFDAVRQGRRMIVSHGSSAWSWSRSDLYHWMARRRIVERSCAMRPSNRVFQTRRRLINRRMTWSWDLVDVDHDPPNRLKPLRSLCRGTRQPLQDDLHDYGFSLALGDPGLLRIDINRFPDVATIQFCLVLFLYHQLDLVLFHSFHLFAIKNLCRRGAFRFLRLSPARQDRLIHNHWGLDNA